jgi:hypothetical protein
LYLPEGVDFGLESFSEFFDYPYSRGQAGSFLALPKYEWSRSMGNWISTLEFNAAWFFPIASLVGLWLCRLSPEDLLRVWSERVFFAMLLLLAGITLRTIAANDQAWLLHTTSLGIMIVGAVIPTQTDNLEAMDEIPLPQ